MVFVVVPAYNEETKIGRVVRGLFEHGYRQVIVVDDGSKDHTAKLAAEAGAIVLSHEINRGQGAALQTGDEYALKNGATAVVHFDGDEQFNPTDIAGAILALQVSHTNVVLGSRFLDDRSRVPFIKRYLILPVSRWINYIFTGVKLTDAHNGFRVLDALALSKIKITQDGMAHNSEIVHQIRQRGLKFIEYPVEVSYSEFGQGIGGGIKILRDLVVGWVIK